MTIFSSTNTSFNSIWFQNVSSCASVLIFDLHYTYWTWNFFHYEYLIHERRFIVYSFIKSIFGKKSNCTEVNRFECTSSKMNSRLQIWSCPLFAGGDSWKMLPCIISIWLSVNWYMGILSIWNQYLAFFPMQKSAFPVNGCVRIIPCHEAAYW